MSTIVITEKEYRKGQSLFDLAGEFTFITAENNEESVVCAVEKHRARHVILGVEDYRSHLCDVLPAGGVIARFGVGHDGVDKDRATKAGLFCTNAPGVLTDSVAELTIGLMLSASRRIVTLASECKGGGWPMAMGDELSGRTLAVIGCGAIGCRVAQIASFGFRMNVVGCDIAAIDEKAYKASYGFNEIYRDFNKAVLQADYVSLHLASVSETHHFINEKRLGQIPKKAWLINTARGALVDEKALFGALHRKELAGAALDVFENEPYIPVSSEYDLRVLDNVILFPHHGSSTQAANERMAERCIENIRNAEACRYDLMDLLNPGVVGSSGSARELRGKSTTTVEVDNE